MATAVATPEEAAEQWAPPGGDEEFEFTNTSEAPAWVDRNWAGYDNGPALAVPAGDYPFGQPYTTVTAHPGDTVKWMAATPSKGAHAVVIPGEPTGENATRKPPMQSNCSLEDALKGGYLTVEDLSDDAKGQVVTRSPHFRAIIEGNAAVTTEPVEVGDYVKIAAA